MVGKKGGRESNLENWIPIIEYKYYKYASQAVRLYFQTQRSVNLDWIIGFQEIKEWVQRNVLGCHFNVLLHHELEWLSILAVFSLLLQTSWKCGYPKLVPRLTFQEKRTDLMPKSNPHIMEKPLKKEFGPEWRIDSGMSWPISTCFGRRAGILDAIECDMQMFNAPVSPLLTLQAWFGNGCLFYSTIQPGATNHKDLGRSDNFAAKPPLKRPGIQQLSCCIIYVRVVIQPFLGSVSSIN